MFLCTVERIPTVSILVVTKAVMYKRASAKSGDISETGLVSDCRSLLRSGPCSEQPLVGLDSHNVLFLHTPLVRGKHPFLYLLCPQDSTSWDERSHSWVSLCAPCRFVLWPEWKRLEAFCGWWRRRGLNLADQRRSCWRDSLATTVLVWEKTKVIFSILPPNLGFLRS